MNGNHKARRQQAILGLVSREPLASQEQIRSRLGRMGIEATQSTISRDVEELGLARVHDRAGVRYVAGDTSSAPAAPALLRRLLAEFALSFTRAEAGLLIRTPPGAANALAEGIDRVELRDVAGTIAGDDTILVMGREGVATRRLERTFLELVEGER